MISPASASIRFSSHEARPHRPPPAGLVGVIGPWNWPLLNNFADCIASLLAGSAVLLKPSRLTPLTSLRVGRGRRGGTARQLAHP